MTASRCNPFDSEKVRVGQRCFPSKEEQLAMAQGQARERALKTEQERIDKILAQHVPTLPKIVDKLKRRVDSFSTGFSQGFE